jgi:4a-hydroxytetrahydrobiopterin dehydratase
MDTLTHAQIIDAGLADWRDLAEGLHARFVTGDFAAGLGFVAAVGEAAEAAGHHPDVALTYPHVDVKLVSHDVGGITQRDIDLASRISGIAREQSIRPVVDALVEVELALDTSDMHGIGPFWAALLTGSADSFADGDVRDKGGRLPLLWFQETDRHATPRQRFHLDVWVPVELAEERIAAAVNAGGTVVDDEAAPAFVVLADAEGNRACVCTTER